MTGDLAAGICVLLLLLTLGTPLPFCFGGALMYLALRGDAGSMTAMFLWGFEQLVNPVLLCIPLFVFAGNLMSQSGMAASLLTLCDFVLGRLRGATGIIAVVSCAVIGAISGSGMTGIAATGPLLIPRMASQGYNRAWATALLANASVLGLLIPPSISMIVYGWVTGTSILACFLSTLLPAILLGLVLCLVCHVYARKKAISISGLPLNQSLKRLPRAAMAAFPALLMPAIILGGIYGGIMTPTESAAVAAAYAIPTGLLIYRSLAWSKIARAATESATAVGSVMAMILFGLMLGQQFVLAGLPDEIASFLLARTENSTVLLLLVDAALMLAGMFLNDVTAILIMSPLLLPLAQAAGMGPIHFAAVTGVNLAMGTLTPPFAGILYFSMRVGNVEFMDIIKPLAILICAGYLPMCFLVTFCEPLALWLPRLFGLA